MHAGSVASRRVRPAVIVNRLAWAAWALLLFTVPITSSPWVAQISGGTPVAPLAGLPLAALLGLWLLPTILRGGRLPRLTLPLAGFVIVALVSSALALFRLTPAFPGQSLLVREVRALLTLGVGLGFYLCAAGYPRSAAVLRRSLAWLYAGAGFAFLWGTYQVGIAHFNFPIAAGVNGLHRLFVMRDMSYTRVTGLTYEPSWFADQLVLLYLPLWIASVWTGYSIAPRRRGLTVEMGLLIWGGLLLFLSISRIGMLGAFALAGVLAWRAGGALAGRLAARIEARGPAAVQDARVRRRMVLGLRISLLLGLGLVLLAAVTLAARIDRRLMRVFTTDYLAIWRESSEPVYAVANRLAYAERVVYWETGLHAFSRAPLLGAGLGNAGFYFIESAPPYAYVLPETIEILTGGGSYPNPKSLWLRLLAETGVAGAACFVVWLILIGLAGRARMGRSGVRGMIGFSIGLALAALAFEGFSLDTFALPQLWLLPGLVSAVARAGFEDGPGPSHVPAGGVHDG